MEFVVALEQYGIDRSTPGCQQPLLRTRRMVLRNDYVPPQAWRRGILHGRLPLLAATIRRAAPRAPSTVGVSSRASRECAARYAPCFHRALGLRSRPSGVRGPVLRPPCPYPHQLTAPHAAWPGRLKRSPGRPGSRRTECLRSGSPASGPVFAHFSSFFQMCGVCGILAEGLELHHSKQPDLRMQTHPFSSNRINSP